MRATTFRKRLDVLAEFYGYLKSLYLVTEQQIDVIKSYRKTIKKPDKHKESLKIHEVHALYQYQPKQQHLELIRDLFVFLCFTGIRFQDLKDFDSRYIYRVEGGLQYRRLAHKTGIEYNIPLCEIVLEILAKYNNKLPVPAQQYGNRAIKDLLKETENFNDVTSSIDKKTGEALKRYEAITLHKGRNTFISNLIDRIPLNQLMRMTGHKKLSTLQQYVAKRDVKNEHIRFFNRATIS